MTLTTKSMAALLGAVGAIAVLLVAGITAARPSPTGEPGVTTFPVEVAETTHFDSLQGLVEGSTAVVDATVTDVRPGRTVAGELDESFTFTLVTIEVIEHLAGEDLGRTVTLEEDGALAPIPKAAIGPSTSCGASGMATASTSGS